MVITSASVVRGAGSNPTSGTAGTAITAGQPVYVDPSTQTLLLAQADTAAHAAATGIALNNAASGQPVNYVTGGPLTIGATVVAGQVYAVSNTAGKICPFADIITGQFTTILGIAISTTVLQVNINPGGVAHG